MELFYLCNFNLMFRLLFLFFVFTTLSIQAQVLNDSVSPNSRYFEDQFYLGITYNFLLNQPEGVEQQNLSYGLQAGFIKDIPFNTEGTIGMGIGLGLGLSTYYSNIGATENEGSVAYEILDDNIDYRRSKLETHSIELPIEFRWRTSTADQYKFWRIYTGVKFEYVYDARSKFVPDSGSDLPMTSFRNPDVSQLQYGLTFNFGYNSFNAHIYYSLSNLLNDDVLLNQESIKIKPLRVGLIFYIL